MLLIESVYRALAEHDLVLSAEDFSTDWCGKSRSWYAERKHSERDFSVTAAIDCLERINMRRTMLKLSNRRMGGLLETEIRVLDEISEALREWLAEQHRITEVRLREMPRGKMLGN